MANLDLHPDRGARPRSLRAARLFSLSGIVPLAAFLMLHLYVNSRALAADASFATALRVCDRALFAPYLPWLLVAAPLAFHGFFGLWLVVTSAPAPEPRPYPTGVRVAMRWTGVAALAFVAFHLSSTWSLSSWVVRGRAESDGLQLASRLASELSSTSRSVPWRAVAYLLGSTCATFHFVVGAWGFFAGTRAGEGARARRWAAWLTAVVGIGIAAAYGNVVAYYATGARLFGGARADTATPAECPAPPP
ncbi:MAG: hypothetical protein M3O50_15130 [Myxococcota bacterium]|nr:hypothetical protein [Myxococcota bacterium]